MNNIEELETTRKKIVELLEVFPVEKRDEILFDKWSLKDVVAHLSNWIIHDLECIAALVSGTEPHWEPSMDEFNHRGVRERRLQTWKVVVDEYKSLNNELIEKYKTLPDDLWDIPIWKGYGLTCRKFVTKDIEHNTEHLNELTGVYKETVKV
jgi:hypothetical protein